MSVGGDGKDRHSENENAVDEQAEHLPYEAPTVVFRKITDEPAPSAQPTAADSVAEPGPTEPPPAEAIPTATDVAAAGASDEPTATPSPPAAPAPTPPAAPSPTPPAASPAEPSSPTPPAALSSTPPAPPSPTPPTADASSPAFPPPDGGSVPPPAGVGASGEPPRGRGSWRKIAVVAGAVVAVAGLLYAADWFVSSGQVPRGVTVAGVAVGGKSHEDAEALLRADLGARAEQPIEVASGDRRIEIVPATAGLGVDWNATLDRAGTQPVDPITRLTSLFSSREIGVVSTVDDRALSAAVDSLRVATDREPVEGDVVFDGSTPLAVAPLPGQVLDVDGAKGALAENWAFGSVEVPIALTPVAVSAEEVDRVLNDVALPSVSGPVTIEGRNGVTAVLPTPRVGELLRFDPDGDGALLETVDTDAAIAILAPQLVSTEVPPKDASFALGGGVPRVVPGVPGELVQWRKTLEQLPTVLLGDGNRTAAAVYEPAPPALTTEAAEKLGVREVIAEYTTGGFEYASGVNIGLTADIVNGALVKPGDTFSLNGYTGPRGTAQGFVESGIIDNGRPDRAVGGGISQFATTLYNAAYFAGMEDAGHTEHSYYISRYPEAREATVFEGAIDLKFTNNYPTGVVIESFADSSSVTVRLWGTKTVDVDSITGSRTNPTSPNTVTLPAGAGCVASGGGPGFTASDTRVISDAATGAQISRDTRTVKYDPIPIVKCQSPQPDPAPPAPSPAEPDSGE